MKTFLSLLLCLWTSVAFGVAPVVMSTRGPKTATTIAAVIEALGHRDSTLVFDSGTWALGSDLEFDDNTTLVFLNGAKFAVASGVVVTIAGVVEAGPWPVFTGAGTVAGPYVIRHRWDTWGTATAPESLGPELVATNGWYDTYTGPGAALQLIEGFDFSVAQNIEATPGSVYRVEVSGVAICNTGG
ncbi:MAG TPA: hypothetical protein VMY37_01575, partial [Thermoguttaceae bacterium]|nr:hypothetical protein [Thermoguttaceae bacterium]